MQFAPPASLAFARVSVGAPEIPVFMRVFARTRGLEKIILWVELLDELSRADVADDRSLERVELQAVLVKQQHNVASNAIDYLLRLPRIMHEYVVLWQRRRTVTVSRPKNNFAFAFGV